MKLQAIALVKLQIDTCAIIIRALENQITKEPGCPNSLQRESDAGRSIYATWLSSKLLIHIMACLLTTPNNLVPSLFEPKEKGEKVKQTNANSHRICNVVKLVETWDQALLVIQLTLSRYQSQIKCWNDKSLVVSREQAINLDDHACQSQMCTDRRKEFEINFCFLHYHVHTKRCSRPLWYLSTWLRIACMYLLWTYQLSTSNRA